jgi:AcrR family transcriptional regulator
MAQVPKREMRSAMLAAAAEELAEVGFAAATQAAIAARAGTSIGNVYKYFTSKQELFEAAVPEALAETLTALLRRRVEQLGQVRDVAALPPAHPYHAASRELFTFALAQRAQIVFLLRRAHGTRYEGYADELARSLVRLALGYAQRAYPGARLGAAQQRSLLRLYRGFLEHIAGALAEERSATALAQAIEHFTRYHLAGLRALFEAAEREASVEARGPAREQNKEEA